MVMNTLYELALRYTLMLDVVATEPFPEGYGATVHFNWPGKGFQLLGAYVYHVVDFSITL